MATTALLAPQTRGRRTAVPVTLSAEDVATLQGWLRSLQVSALEARRARLLLLLADGVPILRAGQVVGLGRHHAYKWIKRFQHCGVDGLRDLPRGPRRPAPGLWPLRVLAILAEAEGPLPAQEIRRRLGRDDGKDRAGTSLRQMLRRLCQTRRLWQPYPQHYALAPRQEEG